ncbi:MAG: GIY-YIG nuclease family protein [Oscillospiraceae bacterium]|nr:GIY-YIG nuclease family protein [Oscillospiraceae bacterium]
METFYVYLLTNRNNRVLYTGVTNDLVRRVYEHKHHLIQNSFTDQYNVDKLVYFEETSSSRAAIEREKQIKGWNRTRKNALVNGMNPAWEDLWERIQ